MPYSKPLDKTTVWVYDNCGNILKKREFALTLDRKKELEEIDFVDNTYVYDGDKLLSYNGNACRYNAHGNLTLNSHHIFATCKKKKSPTRDFLFFGGGDGS